jgi:multimeric flavodoxin WrbA
MKILALIGSPRKGSNTDILVDRVLQGAQSCGHVTEKIYLYDYQITPCLDCRRCKKDDFTCALLDGMSEIYPKLEEADLIVFGTPVYWYGPTAKMKLLIDRMRPFIASRKLKGKRGVVVTPSEEGESCCGPLMEMFRMSFEYLGMTYAGSILAKAYERGEVRDSEDDLKRAYELGASL